MKDSFNLYAELAFLWFENLHRQEGVCLIDVHLLCGTCPVGFQCCQTLAILENFNRRIYFSCLQTWGSILEILKTNFISVGNTANSGIYQYPYCNINIGWSKYFTLLIKKWNFEKKIKRKVSATFHFLTNDFFHFSCQCFWKTKYILVFVGRS